jgi:hypothetical protein
MTQELVLVVLLTGLLGLIWIMTLGTVDEESAAGQNHEPETASTQTDDAHPKSALNRRTITA